MIGILNGYFSGDGCVTPNAITSSSASKRLTVGISLLCNRLGIFGRMTHRQQKNNNFGTLNILPAYILDIRSKWAQIFALKVPMIHDEKQKKLDSISTSLEHRNFPAQNDVVLDAITEINELSPDKYPKLYDLTIPGTFNFMIENGHNQADTADTGYIQRQLVKAMEDLTVQHDGTVRDANMHIVQYHYGEDGLNATKIESTSIGYAKLSEKDIRREFGLVKVDFTPILTDAVISTDSTNYAQTAEMKTYVDQILEDPDDFFLIGFECLHNLVILFMTWFEPIFTHHFLCSFISRILANLFK
ncbi:MAG: LAGLIDADG family homing endonuclease [Paludibacter sp.]